MTTSLERFASRLRRVEKELLARKSPQLANSSIEDGALRVNASDGTETMVIGKQFDGTHTTAILTGPPPPIPMPPMLQPIPGGLRVTFDGTFVDALVVPMDFARFEIHISTDPAFVPDPAVTLRGTVESPRGGEQVFFLPTAEHFVRIVTRSQSGAYSAGSTAVSATPRLVEENDLEFGAVTAAKIAAGAIDADKITANTITQRLLSARPGGGSMVNLVPDARFRDSYVNVARLAIANSLGGDGSANTTGWAVRTITNMLPGAASSWTPGPKTASIDSTIWDDARVPTSKQIFFTLSSDAVAGDVLMSTVVPLSDLSRAIDMNCSGLDWQLEYLDAGTGAVARTETGKYAGFYGGNTVFHASSPAHAAPPAGVGSVRVSLKAPAAMAHLNGASPQSWNAGACVLWTTAGVGAEPGQGVFYWDVANPAVAPTRYCDIVKGLPLVENTALDITVGFSCITAAGAASPFFVQANYEAPDGTRLLTTPQTSYAGRNALQMRFPAPPPGATQLSLTVGNNYSAPYPTRVEVYSVDVEYVSALSELSDVSEVAPTDGAVLAWAASESVWKPRASFKPFDVTVRQTVAQTVGQAVYSPDWTYLNFGTQEEGSTGWSSSAPDRVVLPAIGNYIFSAGWAHNWASSTPLDCIIGVRLYNSDGTIATDSLVEDRVSRPYTGSATISGSVKATTSLGQYLRVYVFHDPGGTLQTVPGKCFLTVHRTS